MNASPRDPRHCIISARVPLSLAAQVDAAASRSGMPRSAWIAQAVREHLRRSDVHLSPEWREHVA